MKYAFMFTRYNDKAIQAKEGLAEYILNDKVYLLRIEDNEKSHYVHTKKSLTF